MKLNLFSLVTVSILFILSFPGCGKDESAAPRDSASNDPIKAQLRGNWQCTYVEESVYMIETGEVLRVDEGESDDIFTFANSYYQKKSSPYRYFVYGAVRGPNGKPVLYMEEYDSRYYTVEVTTLNSTTMIWKITFQGSGAKAIKNMYFKR